MESLGTGDSPVHLCGQQAGCFITYLDLTNDGTWLHPSRRCDLSFQFTSILTSRAGGHFERAHHFSR